MRRRTPVAHGSSPSSHAGKTRTAVALYDAFAVVQASAFPLVLTLLCAPTANLGLVLHALPAVARVLEPLRRKAEAGSSPTALST